MEMALRTHIVRKMISGRIEFTPEFKGMLPGGANSLSFLEVWGMPEGTFFNIYSEYLKMTEQGIPEDEIIKKLEWEDNQFENASNTSVHLKNIEEYIKLRIKRDHGDSLISDEFIDSWIYFIPIWIEDEKVIIKRVQPQIDLLKKVISKDLNYMVDGLSYIIECIKDCKPPLRVIKTALGETHDSYLSLSNELVSHFQSKMINIVNIKHREFSKKKRQFLYEEVSDSFCFGVEVVGKALDVMYWLEGFYMGEPLKVQFEKNLEDINILAKKYSIEKLYKTPKSQFEESLHYCEEKINIIRGTKYFEFEIKKETQILNKIKRWHPFRSQMSKDRQIQGQTERLNIMIAKSEAEKRSKISEEQATINIFKEYIRIFEI